ncbi:MAG: adenylate/guanylate cyclase domain-containing protein [Gammaproteobacteria bacterium]|nr:adenylate/guanylate cyclase domain-containing protein [Gammaproteobacteria bacterium]
MADHQEERRLAAILIADVVGYSRMMGADESGTLTAINAHLDEFIRPLIGEFHGRVVKTLGDGLLTEFASAVNAVQCAVAFQRGMEARAEGVPEEERIQFRIGINVGDIIIQDDDVFGDGVNIAARLEGVAPSGGIVVAASVHEQVKGKLAQAFDDLGPQQVKNIQEPVHAFNVLLDGAGTLTRPNIARETELPSVVVLPFTTTGEAEQEFFADGITEDIIADLSRFPDLFVIARNSSFSYKGRAVKVQEIARDLGVHYVVEGSVRRGGDRVRVTVQLIDASTGKHVSADRFDRKMTDIFDLQDDVTQCIVATLPGRLRLAEAERVRRKPPHDLAAYDCVLAGRIHHHRVTQEDNAKALKLLDRAIKLDPDYAPAYAWKACILGQAMQFGFLEDSPETMKLAMAAIHHALSIEESNVECHRLLCEVYIMYHKLDTAMAHAERALAMNPNDPRLVAQRGELLTWLGKAEEGVEWASKAARLDPLGAPGRAHLLGRACYAAGRYAEAAQAFRLVPSPTCGQRAELAASLKQAGKDDEAKAVVAEFKRDCSEFSVAAHIEQMPFTRQEDRDHLAAGMNSAGV